MKNISAKPREAKALMSRAAPVLRAGARPRLRPGLQQAFTSLKYRNYRLWFMGQLASLVGTWMQTTAQGFLVFQLTHSPAYLGYVGFAAGIPTWLFTLYGGVASDRMSRRKLLIITQTSMMCLAFVLAALTFANIVQAWHIVCLAFLLGIANAFDAPARQSFVLELVEREELTNAIALNAAMFNSATAVGPAVAGVTYALFGPAWCFTLNGISFLAVIIALSMMHIKLQPARARLTSVLGDVREGLDYVANHPRIRALILLAAMTSLFGMGCFTLFPAWAVTVLHGDSTTNGFLQSARGVGAVLGALMLAALSRFRFKGKLLTVGSFVFPLLLLVFAAARWVPLSLLALVGVGWGYVMMLNTANALVQTAVSDELRGRVMGLYTLGFLGVMPIGSLLAGGVAEVTSEPLAVVLSALIMFGFAAWLWLRVPRLRALE